MNENVPLYVLHGLSATPILVAQLVAGLTEAQLDIPTGPERFTVREVIAHMADWEAVCQERLSRTVGEDEPLLPNWDEDQAALDHHYAQSELAETLARFTERRAALLAFLESLAPAAWRRTARRDENRCDLLGMVAIQLGHDGYHIKQLAEYREQIARGAVS